MWFFNYGGKANGQVSNHDFFSKKNRRGEVQQGLSKWSSITYEELDVIEPKSGKERVGQDPWNLRMYIERFMDETKIDTPTQSMRRARAKLCVCVRERERNNAHLTITSSG